MAYPATHTHHIHRYTRTNYCPICGGYSAFPLHHPSRCRGFLSDDGKYAYCQRDERANGLPLDGPLDTYRHYLAGDCRCSINHATNRPAAAEWVEGLRPARVNRRLHTGQPDVERVVEDHYEIRALDGELVATHIRYRPKSFGWRSPSGAYSLEGRRPDSLPLYGTELLRDMPPGSQVVLTEGEKAAKALRERFEMLDLKIAVLSGCGGAAVVPSDAVLRVLRRYAVVIWPDNDEPGQKWARAVAAVLRRLGCKEVRWLQPYVPSIKGYDAADFDGDDDELFTYLDTAVLYVDEHVEQAEAGDETGRELRGSRHLSTRVRHKIEDIARAMTAKLQSANEYELADNIAGCKTTFVKGKCANCGYEPANPVACKESLCPLCFPSRLLVDWKRKTEALGLPSDTKHRLYRLRPVNPVPEDPKALSIVGQRFTEARKRYKDLRAGVIGLRWSRQSGAVALAALPAGERELEGEYGPFTVEFVREVDGPEDVAFWLIDEYLAELEEAFSQTSTREDAWAYLRQVRRRRRFAGFGKYHKSDEQGENESGHPDIESYTDGNLNRGVSVDYSKLSGGANLHKKGELYPCPNCGEHTVAYTSQRVAADLVEKLNGHYRVKGVQA